LGDATKEVSRRSSAEERESRLHLLRAVSSAGERNFAY